MTLRVDPLNETTNPPVVLNKGQSISEECSRPVVFIGKVLGLLSWNISIHTQNNEPHGTRQAADILYSLTLKIIVIYLTAHEYFMTQSMKSRYNSKIRIHAAMASRFIPLILMILIISFSLCAGKRFLKLLSRLEKIDNLLKGIVDKQRFLLQYTIHQVVISAFLAVYCSTRVFLDNYSYFQKVEQTAYLIVLYAHDVYIIVFFNVTANLCAKGFEGLNIEMNKMRKLEKEAISDYLACVHCHLEHLYELKDSLQEAFSLLITAMLSRMAFAVCLVAYQLVNLKIFTLLFYELLLLATIYTYRIFCIATSADNITTKARHCFKTLMNTIVCRSISVADEIKIMALGNMLSQCPVEVASAGNLFTVNRTTFTTIMGTILSYLIILVQFSPQDKPKEIIGNITKQNATCSN